MDEGSHRWLRAQRRHQDFRLNRVTHLSTITAANAERRGDSCRAGDRYQGGRRASQRSDDRAICQSSWSGNGLRRLSPEHSGEDCCRALLRPRETRGYGLYATKMDGADRCARSAELQSRQCCRAFWESGRYLERSDEEEKLASGARLAGYRPPFPTLRSGSSICPPSGSFCFAASPKIGSLDSSTM